ncbi:MAG: substrate-binding domain-containing protein [Alphaproteobacteria bacterium]|nr:substrate-binding domain-containing protein [Alphaproteobacteria bacterium]
MVSAFYRSFLQITIFIAIMLFSSVSFAADRMAIIFQQESNEDFRNTLYSGALDAATLYDYKLDVHHVLFSSGSNPKNWFDRNVAPKRPKAIIVVDTALSGYTQDLIDLAIRNNIPVGVINGNLDHSYQGAAFKVGSMQSDEGKLAGEYLSEFSNQAPLCISYLTATRNDKLRCQGLANGMGISVYQLNSDAQYNAIYNGVQSFLSVARAPHYVVITDQSLITPLLKVQKAIKDAGLGDFNIGFVGQAGSQVSDYILRQQIDFAVHDQPFFQGYWAVSAMALQLTFKLEPQHLVASGPMVIDRDIAQIIKQGQNIVTLNIKEDKRRPASSTSKRTTYPGIKPLRLTP